MSSMHEPPIDLYYWPTPNGRKIPIMLEECGLDYRVVPVALPKGEQREASFRALNPNGKMPVLVDHAAPEGPLTVFESGAILLYLAEKAGRFLPADPTRRWAAVQWLMWQMAGLGPMAGQLWHFDLQAPDAVPYARARYRAETKRLLDVMEGALATRPYLAGEYSVADMAAWPWVDKAVELLGGDSGEPRPHLERWRAEIAARPAVVRAEAVAERVRAG